MTKSKQNKYKKTLVTLFISIIFSFAMIGPVHATNNLGIKSIKSAAKEDRNPVNPITIVKSYATDMFMLKVNLKSFKQDTMNTKDFNEALKYAHDDKIRSNKMIRVENRYRNIVTDSKFTLTDTKENKLIGKYVKPDIINAFGVIDYDDPYKIHVMKKFDIEEGTILKKFLVELFDKNGQIIKITDEDGADTGLGYNGQTLEMEPTLSKKDGKDILILENISDKIITIKSSNVTQGKEGNVKTHVEKGTHTLEPIDQLNNSLEIELELTDTAKNSTKDELLARVDITYETDGNTYKALIYINIREICQKCPKCEDHSGDCACKTPIEDPDIMSIKKLEPGKYELRVLLRNNNYPNNHVKLNDEDPLEPLYSLELLDKDGNKYSTTIEKNRIKYADECSDYIMNLSCMVTLIATLDDEKHYDIPFKSFALHINKYSIYNKHGYNDIPKVLEGSFSDIAVELSKKSDKYVVTIENTSNENLNIKNMSLSSLCVDIRNEYEAGIRLHLEEGKKHDIHLKVSKPVKNIEDGCYEYITITYEKGSQLYTAIIPLTYDDQWLVYWKNVTIANVIKTMLFSSTSIIISAIISAAADKLIPWYRILNSFRRFP